MGSDCSVLQEHLPFAGLTGLRVDLMRERERGKERRGRRVYERENGRGGVREKGVREGKRGEGRERHRRRDREPASVIKQT